MKHIPEDIDPLIKEAEVMQVSTLSKMSIRRGEAEGTFPKRLKIGHRRVAWRLSEVQQWIEDRAAERDTPIEPAPQIAAKVKQSNRRGM